MNFIKTLKIICATALLGACVSSWALPMTTLSTVGGLDGLLATTRLYNSGQYNELNWARHVLGLNVQYDGKQDGGFDWLGVSDSPKTFAQALPDSPDYFLVKTGKLDGTNHNSFLFQNLPSQKYAVLNLADMGFGSKEGIGKISHITMFSVSEEKVPEPGTLSLLVLGMLGLVLARRRYV